MFKPISDIDYLLCDEEKQILVCTLDDPKDKVETVAKWKTRAAAIFAFEPSDDLLDVVRDILANPQIRAVVLDGEGLCRGDFYNFWQEHKSLGTDIKKEHLEAVQRFVDLFEEDCSIGALPPFWPERLRYETPESPDT